MRGPDGGIARLVARLGPYAARRWSGVLAVLATTALMTAINVLRPWPLQILVDHVLGGRPLPAALASLAALLPGAESRDGLLLWCVASTVVLFLLGWAVGLAGSYASIVLGQRLVYDLGATLFGHLQRLSLRFHSRQGVGDSIKRVTGDTTCVAVIVRDAMLPALAAALGVVATLVVMWRVDAGLALLSLATVPIMGATFRRYASALADRSWMQQEADARQYDVVERALGSLPVVQAYGRERAAAREYREVTDRILGATLAATDVQFRYKIFMGLASALGTAAILWLGARRVLAGELTVGVLLVFASYLATLYGPLEAVMYSPSTALGASGSAARVLEILDTAPDVRDRPGAAPLPPSRGHVTLDDVRFGYESGVDVLRGVSLEVRPGERVAIVGATGAGKSTLVSLVPRFFDPTAGRVLVDGHDVRDVRLASLRAQVAIVLQEPFLFPMSVADNIAYGRPDATRDAIVAAAHAANAHEFVERLPDGYDTVLGERGATLSVGQRQRLAIARALVKDAPILVLDEPTSALDAGSEALLLDALDRLMAGRTCFVIAHRLSTIRTADRIVVLADGRVAEQGTHAELLALGGTYATLHRLQSGTTLSDPTAA
jgi:ATP-binding cassette, subfamily B, bacterial